jgi:HAD superfamily hydrolase (TIGR01490 family)
VDNTIIRGASSYQLAKELRRRKFFGTRDIIKFGIIQARYLLQGESKKHIEQVRERALALVKGHSAAEVVAIGEEVYDTVLALRIFPGTKAIIDEHLANGDEVWFITASPVEVGELIARRLGATGALGTVGETVNGIYTGKMIGDLMHGKAKADAIRKLAVERNLDLDASYAYSDSLNDLPMMTLVGHPRPINPDTKLKHYAKKMGWATAEFRNKRIVGHPVRTSAIAGGTWVFGLIIRAIRKSLRRRVTKLIIVPKQP